MRNGLAATKTTQVNTDFVSTDTKIEVVDASSFSIGDKIVVLNTANEGFYATINSITETAAPAADLGLDFIIAATGDVPIGQDVTDGYSGFSNDDRTGVSTLSSFQSDFMTYQEGIIDGEVTNFSAAESSILSAVQSLSDLKNKASNQAYENSISTMITAISTWQGEIQRYGDTALDAFILAMTNRLSDALARVASIQTFLGSASQSASGDFTGSGIFFDFAQWEDKRINLASGSRSLWYGASAGLTVTDKNIAILDTNRQEQESYFVIAAFSNDADGTNTISVASSSGINATDQVKVIASGQAIINATVTSTTATTITIDQNIGTAYTVDAKARIVKQK